MPVLESGQLAQFTDEQIDSWGLSTRGVRDGTHPTERFGPDGATCERSWFCNWADRYDVKDWLVGRVSSYLDGGEIKLSRLSPQVHPDSEYPSLVCTKVTSITGHQFIEDDVDGMPSYSRAELKVLYELVNYSLKDDGDTISEMQRYVTDAGSPGDETKSSVEYVNLPGGSLNFLVEGGATSPPFSAPHMTPIPYGLGFPLVREEFSVTWKRIPYAVFAPGSELYTRIYGDPAAGTRPFLGAYNENDAFLGRKAGTTQLIACEPRLLPDPDGRDWSWDIKYRFSYSPETVTALYFFDTRRNPDGSAVTPSLSGWYQVGRGPQWYAAGEAPDNTTLFVARTMTELFNPGA